MLHCRLPLRRRLIASCRSTLASFALVCKSRWQLCYSGRLVTSFHGSAIKLQRLPTVRLHPVLELVIGADAPPQVLMPPISGRRVVDFGVGLGRRTTYLYNLPEVASAASCMKVRSLHLPPPVPLPSQAQTSQRLPG